MHRHHGLVHGRQVRAREAQESVHADRVGGWGEKAKHEVCIGVTAVQRPEWPAPVMLLHFLHCGSQLHLCLQLPPVCLCADFCLSAIACPVPVAGAG
jgi:hypothetical protein